MTHATIWAGLGAAMLIGLAACGPNEPGAYRSGAYGASDYGHAIPGTNAVVGPGPVGEDWHKEPRE